MGDFNTIIPDMTRAQQGNKVRDASVKVGMVLNRILCENNQIKYMVDAWVGGRRVPGGIPCVVLTRFGGIWNIEEYSFKGWADKSVNQPIDGMGASFQYKAGDHVLIACINGSGRDGVILGGLKHPGREGELDADEIAYLNRFNGLEKSIDKDGAYKVTFNGAPVNTAQLDAPPTSSPLPKPIYDSTVAGSFYGFDNTGSFEVNDAQGQSLRIDKTSKGITVKSGVNTLEITSIGETNITNVSTTIKSIKSFDIQTLIANIAAVTSITLAAPSVTVGSVTFSGGGATSTSPLGISTPAFKLLSPKIAIGNGVVDLIDTLVKLIEELGLTVVTTVVAGVPTPSTPFSASPNWAKIKLTQAALASLRGLGA
jgi:hypothetical protein